MAIYELEQRVLFDGAAAVATADAVVAEMQTPDASAADSDADSSGDANSADTNHSADSSSSPTDSDQSSTDSTPDQTQIFIDTIVGTYDASTDGENILATPDNADLLTSTPNTENLSAAHEVVFINSSVMDADEIVDDLSPNAEVVYLTKGSDGIQQITDYLADKTDIDTIRIISHGNEGYFVLNGQIIDNDYLAENSNLIASWGEHLSENADIMLYGCNLAATAEGKDFVEHFADLTGADVAAATHLTGGDSDYSLSADFSLKSNSDWALDFSVGSIESTRLSVDGYDYHLASHTVTSNADSGADTLRYWIDNAASGDEIVFNLASGNETIELASVLTISKNLTIDGNNSAGSGTDITINGNDGSGSNCQIFSIDSCEVTIENMTLTNGYDNSTGGGAIYTTGATATLIMNNIEISASIADNKNGGAICIASGTVTMTDCTVDNNFAEHGTTKGGGIYNAGTLSLNNCVITSNSAESEGGGIYNAGTITLISNSTISGNSSNSNGGGIMNNDNAGMTISNSTIFSNTTVGNGGGIASPGDLTYVNITDTTISGNTATTGSGGGVYFNSPSGGGTLTLENSIIANNGSSDLYFDQGTLTNHGYNVVTYINNTSLLDASDIYFDGSVWRTNNGTVLLTNQALNLDNQLSYNGGFTETVAVTDALGGFLTTSQAAGHSDNQTDQRGYYRTSTAVTRGAYQYDGIVAKIGTDTSWTGGVDTYSTIQNAIDLATEGNTIVLASTSILMSSAEMAANGISVDKALTITGEEADSTSTIVRVTTPGSSNFRVFYIDAPTSTDLNPVTIENMTIEGGDISGNGDDSAGYGGGIYVAEGTLSLTNSAVSGSTAYSGGGIYGGLGVSLTLENVTVSGNSASGDSSSGGGIYTDGGTLEITNSTISGNTAHYSGGGIYATSGILEITSSTISNNSATTADGGGISLAFGGLARIVSTTISENTACCGGGGIYSDAVDGITIISSTISNNSATAGGGGIENNNYSPMTITSSTISDNTVASGSGGGIGNYGSTLTITSSTISGNTASSSGGGIYNEGATLYSTNSIITYNYLTSNIYSDIYNDNGTIYGNYNISSWTNWDTSGGLTTTGNVTYTYDPSTGYGATLFASYETIVADNIYKPVLADNGGTTTPHTYTVALAAGSIASGTGAVTGTYEDSDTKYAFKVYGTTTWEKVEDGSNIDTGTYTVTQIEDDQRGETIIGKPSIGAYFLEYTPPLYYMAQASGDWSTPGESSIWYTSTTGTEGSYTTHSTTATPDATNAISILIGDGSSYNVTVITDTSVEAKLITISNGSSLSIPNSVTLTVDNDETGTTDLAVNGTLDMDGGTVTLGTGATLAYGASSTLAYIYTGNAQETGNEFASSLNNLTLDNASTVTVASGSTIGGILNIGTGTILSTSQNITVSGTTSGAGTVNASAGTITYSTVSQTVFAGTYNILELTGDGTTKTFADGTTSVAQKIELTNSMTLTGYSKDNVTVQVTTPGTSTFRVFYIDAPTSSALNPLTIENMTIKGGDISGNGDNSSGYGGGIYVAAGTLNLTNSTVSGSTAYSGGGIYNSGTGTATITSSTISDNTATNRGGGIYNGGTATITTSTINGNNASDPFSSWGGGIANVNGTLTILSSTIAENTGYYGGGIYNNSTLTIVDSTVRGNTGSYGGGLFNAGGGTSYLLNSIIINNTSDDIFNSGTAVYAYYCWYDASKIGAGSITNTLGASAPNVTTAYDSTLNALADNGGSTETMEVNSASSKAVTGTYAYSYHNDTDGYYFYNVAGDTAYKLVGLATPTAPLPADKIATDQRGYTKDATQLTIGAYAYNGTLSETYTVTETTDDGTGITEHTLSWAITQSNTHAGTDSIIFNLVSGASLTISAAMPTITDSVTIDGTNLGVGGGDVTVQVTTPGTSTFRVFYINAPTSSALNPVTIENMTIKGGDISDHGVYPPTVDNYGGSIYIAAGTVTLDTVTVSGSVASRGGGIYNSNGSTMSITNSTISENSVPTGKSYDNYGGGIYNDGTMNITSSSTITDNIVYAGTADSVNGYGHGGGIYNDTGTLTITSSTVSNNTAEYYLNTSGSIYTCGGGIYNNTGSLTITSSTIIGNAANGADMCNGGGICNNTGSLTVTSSTVVGNIALGNGGGISNSGTASITSSTVSGNIADQTGGGIYNDGTFIITSSTITGNTGYFGLFGGSTCGGIFNGTGTLYLLNSIVAGNYGDYDLDNPSFLGGTANGYYSWIGSKSEALTTDVNCIDTPYSWDYVYGLADYGGDTLTMLVGMTGSPALDAGTLTGIDISDNACWYKQSDSTWYTYDNVATTIQTINDTDQRGEARPDTASSSIATIGATQYVATDSTYVNYIDTTTWTVVTTDDDSLDVTDGHVSLREALTFAASGSTITFSGITTAATDHILPLIGRTLTINGGDTVTISGDDTDSDSDPDTVTGLLNVTSTGNLTIRNITITKGKAYYGGGIYNTGTLAVASSTISDNTVTASGGGIYNNDTATINSSTVSENDTTSSLGAGGGIYNSAGSNMTITSSTISNNTSLYDGGGISNNGTMTITSSTISGNTSLNNAGGCGVLNDGTLYITNSIIAYNYSSIGVSDEYYDIEHNGGSIYGNYNISSYTSWGAGTGNVTYTYNSITGYGATLFAAYTNPIVGNTYIHKPDLSKLPAETTYTVALATGSIASGSGSYTGTYNSGANYVFSATGMAGTWKNVTDGSASIDPTSTIITDQRGETITGTPSIGAYFLAYTPSTLYYMAHTLSGSNWEDLTVWKTSTSSSTNPIDYTTAATVAPNASNSAGIIIYDGITVTVTAASVDLSIDQTTINSTASIIIDDGVTLTIANGTEDIDLDAKGSIVVNAATGTLLIASGASVDSEGTFTVNGVLSFDDGSTNNGTLNMADASITIASLTAGSGTITYDGAGQTIAGVTYNALQLSGSGTKTATGTLEADSLTVDLGVTLEAESLIVSTTFTNNGTTRTSEITVSLPDAAVGGTFVYAGPGWQQIDNLNGNAYNILQLSSPGPKTATGTLQANTLTVDNGIMLQIESLTVNTTFINDGETSASGTVSLPDAAVGGTFTYNGIGQAIDNLGGYAYSALQLTGSGTNTATGTLQADTLRVDPAVTLDVVNLTVNTDFQNNGTTQASGAVSLPDAPVTGTFIYDGATQTIDNLGDTGEYQALQLSGSGTKTVSDTLQAQNLTVDLGVTLDAVNLTVNTTFTNTGTTQASGTVSLPDDAAVNGTFIYDGTDQTIDSLGGNAYNILQLTGSGTKTLSGDVSVTNAFTLDHDVTTDVGAHTLTVTGASDINGTVTISTGTYDANGDFDATDGHITFTDNGNLKLGGATITNLGTLSTDNGTVWYDRAGDQTVLSDNYHNLRISGDSGSTKTLGGLIRLLSAGDLTIDSDTTLDVSASNYGIFILGNWVDDGTFNAREGTVTFNGTTQSIGAETFYNLTTIGTGTQTLGGTVTVENTLNTGAGTTFALSSYTLNIGSLNAGTGSWTNSATFNKDTGTVNYADDNAQIVLALEYYTLGLSGAGSTKTFADGTTKVDNQISLTDSITLTGSSASAVTVQVTTPYSEDPDNATHARVFYITGGTVNISNMTIKGGNISPLSGSDRFGGGIYISGGTVNLNTVTVFGSKASHGSGIYNNSTLTIDSSTISNNNATSNGGGIYNDSQGVLTITSSTISGNSADINGGGIFNSGASVTIISSTISGNSASASSGYGGGLYNSGTSLTITSSTISGNSASFGGGIVNSNVLTITSSTISGNSASFGGGIYNYSATTSKLYLTNSIVAYNYKSDYSGYIDIYKGALSSIYGNYNIAGNWDSSWGGTGNVTYTYTSGKGATLFASYETILADTIYKPDLADNGGTTTPHTYTVALAAGSIASGAGVRTGYYDDAGATKYVFSADGTTWYKVENGTDTVPSVNVTEITTDQRGVVIDNDDPCVGAYYMATLYAFRTKTTGEWNDYTTWQRYKGGAWIDLTASNPTPEATNSLSITILTGNIVTVTESVTIDQTTIDSGGQITVSNGYTLTITDGTGTDLTVDGTGIVDVDFGGIIDATGATITYTGTGNLYLGGAVTSIGTFTAGSSTVTYDSATDQNIAAITYYNLATSGNGTRTLGGDVTVTNDLTMGNSTTLAVGATTLTVNGVSDINGAMTISTGSVDANGAFDATGGTIIFTGAGNLYLGDTVTSLGTFTAGSSTVTYDGTNQTVSALAYYNLALSGIGSTKTFADGTTSVAQQISITQNMTLTGSGTGTVTVQVTMPYNWDGTSGAAGATNSRVFTIWADTTISNMTIKGGNLLFGAGGALYVESGTTNLNNVVISGSSAQQGGAAYLAAAGTLIVTDSTIDHNTTTLQPGTDTYGGFIYNMGNLTVNNSIISNNRAKLGGAIFNASAGGVGIVSITSGSQIINNSSTGSAGGIYNENIVSIDSSSVSGNTAASDGGGILSWVSLTITDSEISNNTASGAGGTNGGGGILNGGTLELNGINTFSGNSAVSNKGDAIYNFDAGDIVDLNASTLNLSEDSAIYNVGTFTAGTSTVDYNGAAQTIAGLTYYNLTTSGSGTKTLGGDVTADNNLTVGDSTTLAVGTTALTVNGASDINGTMTVSTGSVDANGAFDATGGTITFTGAGNLYLGSTVTSLGTFTAGSSTVTYDASGDQTIAAITYYNLTTSGSGTKTLGGDLTVNNNLTVGSGTSLFDALSGAYSLTCDGVGGNAEIEGTIGYLASLSIAGTSTISNEITTIGDQTYTGLMTLSGSTANLTSYGNINLTGGVADGAGTSGLIITALGTTTLGGGSSIDIGGTLTLGAGNFVTNGGNITAGGLDIQAGTFNSASSGGTWDINGDVTIALGAALNATSGTFTVSGNWSNSGTFTANDNTVTFDGSADQTISGSSTFYNLTIANTGDPSTVKVDASTSTSLAVTNNILVNDGKFISATDYNNVSIASGAVLELSGDITVSGNWSNSGTFTPGAYTVTLDGADQEISAETFYSLVSNGAGLKTLTGNVTIENALTLTSGIFILGNYNMVLQFTGNISGTGSSTNMIASTGTGKLRKYVDGTSGTLSFPVGTYDTGTSTASYSPASISFAAGTYSAGAYIEISVTADKYADNPSTTDYLNRYWDISSSGITNYSATVSCTYLASDVTGTEADIEGIEYASGVWSGFSAASISTHSFAITAANELGIFTGGEAASLGHFEITTIAGQTAGSAFSITITAYDQYGNIAAGYTGTATLSDTSTTITPTTTAAFVSGVNTTSVTVTQAGTDAITATNGSITGTSNSFTVAAGAVDHVTVTPDGETITAGETKQFTASAYDEYGNLIASNKDSFIWTQTSAPDSGLFDNTTADDYTVSATYGGKTGYADITVVAGAAAAFDFTTIAGQTAGTAFSITITAYDQYGNIAAGYTGTATLSDTSTTITPTTTAAFVSGVNTTSVTVTQAGTDAITATDGLVTDTSNSFTVAAARRESGMNDATITSIIDDSTGEPSNSSSHPTYNFGVVTLTRIVNSSVIAAQLHENSIGVNFADEDVFNPDTDNVYQTDVPKPLDYDKTSVIDARYDDDSTTEGNSDEQEGYETAMIFEQTDDYLAMIAGITDGESLYSITFDKHALFKTSTDIYLDAIVSGQV